MWCLHVLGIVWFQKMSIIIIMLSSEGSRNSWGWLRSQRLKTIRKYMKLNQRGGGRRENHFWGDVWMICETTHYDFVLPVVCYRTKLLLRSLKHIIWMTAFWQREFCKANWMNSFKFALLNTRQNYSFYWFDFNFTCHSIMQF